jgi:hypothetical protein
MMAMFMIVGTITQARKAKLINPQMAASTALMIIIAILMVTIFWTLPCFKAGTNMLKEK